MSRIANLSDDLAMALSAVSIRIIAPIPGKAVVGIEIPNKIRQTVYLREIIESSAFADSKTLLTLSLGKTIAGEPFVADLTKMPHLLVAGSTGSGKSVSLNTMICSILFKAIPMNVRFMMIDLKMLELSFYDGIPHLLLPVMTNAEERQDRPAVAHRRDGAALPGHGREGREEHREIQPEDGQGRRVRTSPISWW